MKLQQLFETSLHAQADESTRFYHTLLPMIEAALTKAGFNPMRKGEKFTASGSTLSTDLNGNYKPIIFVKTKSPKLFDDELLLSLIGKIVTRCVKQVYGEIAGVRALRVNDQLFNFSYSL